MVIKEEKPITLAEVVNLAGGSEKALAIKKFIKNFDVLPINKVEELRKELKALDLIKLKEDHIVKIIDFMPGDASELNKIASDVSLDQEETSKILGVVSKY
ncbi:MAG: hypothetical protein NUV97_04015 [archaeon]|nr:hypothetical protein [archaeon]